MTRSTRSKKAYRPAVWEMPCPKPGNLPGRVWPPRTCAEAWNRLLPTQLPGQASGNLQTAVGYKASPGHIRRSWRRSLGQDISSEAASGGAAFSAVCPLSLPLASQAVHCIGQCECASSQRGQDMGKGEQRAAGFHSDECFVAEPDRMSLHPPQKICSRRSVLPRPQNPVLGHAKIHEGT